MTDAPMTRQVKWLIAVVAIHFIVSIIHGGAHAAAHVWLPPFANLFVFVVIIAGPLTGLAVMRSARRAGSWIVAVTMAGSLGFGLAYHFLVANPDHVTHVDARWRLLFAATAALLAVTEALGCGLAIHAARGGELS